jgi:hypothetical protein
MRVTVSRTGGYAGVDEELGTIVTESLSAEEAARVERTVDALAEAGPSEVGADLFQYRIDIMTDEGERSLSFADAGDPGAPANPALAELIRLARPTSQA